MKKENDNNKKIYITTRNGVGMDEDMIKKMLEEMIKKPTWASTNKNNNLYAYYDYNILGNAMKYLLDDEDVKLKEQLPEITDLQDLFEKLDSEEIDNVKFWINDSELELHTEGKKPEEFKIRIPEMKADNILVVIKSYLNKTGKYLIDGASTKLYAVNLTRADSKGFAQGCFDNYKDSKTVRIRYKTDWYTVGKKRLEQIFELFPDVKVLWLKIVKKEVEKGKKIIDAIENHSVYEITDEDRLLMEVMDD